MFFVCFFDKNHQCHAATFTGSSRLVDSAECKLLLAPSNVNSLQCRTLILSREALNNPCEATGRNSRTSSMAAVTRRNLAFFSAFT